MVYGNTNKALEYIIFEEGVIRKLSTGYSWEYNLKGHLGNTRAVFVGGETAPTLAQTSDYYPFGQQFAPITTPNNNNKYLYNGKELQTETLGGSSLNLLEYGARFYDAQIGRFTTVDPLAEKYFRMTAYGYCGGNPINSFDVNGEWIYILHEGEQYKYDNGQLYQYQKEGDNAGSYTEYCAGTNDFLDGVANGLNDLSSKSETGGNLVGYFGNDENNAYLKQNSEGDANNINKEGTNTINLNPKLKGSDIPTEKGVVKSEFWLDIGHELAHKQDFINRGDEAKQDWLTTPSGEKIPDTEKYATLKENQMREDAGLPLRTHYATQGSQGWEPSRIINKKGVSVYYPGINLLPIKKRK